MTERPFDRSSAIERDQPTAFDQVLPEHAALVASDRPDEEQHLNRLVLRRLTEDDVPHLGTATLQSITWSTVSGFKGLESDVIIVAGLTDIESDWHRGVAYLGMSRAHAAAKPC